MRTLLVALFLCLSATSAFATPLGRTDREAVLRNLAEVIATRYVDAAKGAEMASAIRNSETRWKDHNEAERFATDMTAWLRDLSGDGHFQLTFSEEVITEEGEGDAFSEAEIDRYYGAHLNHGIEKIERLEGNVMLLDIRAFPPSAMAGDVYAAAMTVVAQGDALIIDLRNNGGGMDTINLLMGYLLPPESPLSGTYNRPLHETLHRNSPAWVPGRRFGETKPLFILTSKRTFSAAEALAYDLQVLNRATIVGEGTGGGANPFEYRRVHPHFAVSLPEMRSINPLTGTNWQGAGVTPDVPAPAAEALATALRLALVAASQSHSTVPNGMDRDGGGE